MRYMSMKASKTNCTCHVSADQHASLRLKKQKRKTDLPVIIRALLMSS